MGYNKDVKDFTFPSNFGFTGSAHDRPTVTVRPHERARPQRYARGGKVRKAEGGIIDKLKSVFGSQVTESEADKFKNQTPPTKVAEAPPKKDTVQIDPKGSTVDTLKNQRERQMKELGLKKGGRVKHKPPKIKKFHGASFPAGDFDNDGDADGDTDGDGMRKGGKVKRAMGGPVKAAKGGMRKIAKEVVKEHVNYPAPKGHKGLKGC